MPDLDKENLEANKPHLHKPISSIFGQGPTPTVEKGPQEAVKTPEAFRRSTPQALPGPLKFLWQVLLIMSVVLIVLIVVVYAKEQKEAKRRIALEGQLAKTKAEMEAMVKLVGTLKESAKISEGMKSELDQMKANAADIVKKVRNLNQEKSDLESALQKRSQKIQELTNQMADLEKTKADLENRAVSSPPKPQVSESPQAKAPASQAPVREGKILVVKPASGMAVVNLGNKDGIQSGSVFEIYGLKNDFIAKLVIDEVEETIAIGKITPQTASGKVKEDYIAELIK